MIDVAVGFPGAGPREVERRIVEPLERAIWEIEAVEYVYSASYPGMAITTGVNQGLSNEQAARFAFLMAVPVIAGGVEVATL